MKAVGSKMKITRRQLRKLISETIYGRKGYKVPPTDPMTRVPSGPMKDNLQGIIDSDDETNQRQGYDFAIQIQEPDIVFPIDQSEPYEELAYQGDDYLDDLRRSKEYYHQVGIYSPESPTGTTTVNVPLPYEIIDLVVSAWNVWRKDKSKDIQFGQALNKYYDYVNSQVNAPIGWWGEDGIHPELDQALHDGSFSV